MNLVGGKDPIKSIMKTDNSTEQVPLEVEMVLIQEILEFLDMEETVLGSFIMKTENSNKRVPIKTVNKTDSLKFTIKTDNLW